MLEEDSVLEVRDTNLGYFRFFLRRFVFVVDEDVVGLDVYL